MRNATFTKKGYEFTHVMTDSESWVIAQSMCGKMIYVNDVVMTHKSFMMLLMAGRNFRNPSTILPAFNSGLIQLHEKPDGT